MKKNLAGLAFHGILKVEEFIVIVRKRTMGSKVQDNVDDEPVSETMEGETEGKKKVRRTNDDDSDLRKLKKGESKRNLTRTESSTRKLCDKSESKRKLLDKSESKRRLLDKGESKRKVLEKTESKRLAKTESKRKLLGKAESKRKIDGEKRESKRNLLEKSVTEEGESTNDGTVPSREPKLSQEDYQMAIKALAFMKLNSFKTAALFEKEIKSRYNEFNGKDIEKAMSKDMQSSSLGQKKVGNLDLNDSVHGRRSTVRKSRDPTEDSSESSGGSSSNGEDDRSSSTPTSLRSKQSLPKRGIDRKVSFGNVSTDEFVPFSPKKKDKLFYSKDEIDQFKFEDAAEKKEVREKERQERRAAREKQQAERDEEIKRSQAEQVAQQKKKLEEGRKRREDEWKKQQEQAEAMEKMMKDAMAWMK